MVISLCYAVKPALKTTFQKGTDVLVNKSQELSPFWKMLKISQMNLVPLKMFLYVEHLVAFSLWIYLFKGEWLIFQGRQLCKTYFLPSEKMSTLNGKNFFPFFFLIRADPFLTMDLAR